ncbi:MAG: hypothetical protein JNL05_10490 [Flavobacteriales bacterium]|nr:hypothetical protein [Flavobacteriales bacterium]
MARNSALISKRNHAIRSKYESLRAKRVKGRKVYTAEYVIQMLSDEFFIATSTVEDIVYRSR